MEIIAQYLLKVSLALLVFYPFYRLVLRSETYYHMNRFYLLGSMILSLLFPFFVFHQARFASPSVAYFLNEITVGVLPQTEMAGAETQPVYSLMAWIYISGVLIFFTRFVWNLIAVIRLRSTAAFVQSGTHRIFLVDQRFSSFSFGKWIFLDKDTFQHEKRQVVINHEMAHIRQYHTLDLFLVEILQLVLWFHPVIWLYKRSLNEVHEYLADYAVLNQGCDTVGYMEFLMQQIGKTNITFFTSHFNHSLITRRFAMITKDKSTKVSAIKIAILLPVLTLGCFFLVNAFSFSSLSTDARTYDIATFRMIDPVPAPRITLDELPAVLLQDKKVKKSTEAKHAKPQPAEEDKDVYTVVETMPEYPGGQEARNKYIQQEIKYPQLAKDWGIGSTVYVQFVIDQEGNLIKPKVLKIAGSYINPDGKKASEKIYQKALQEMKDEALRVVSGLPGKWNPGVQKEKKVKVSFVMPIKFSLS